MFYLDNPSKMKELNISAFIVSDGGFWLYYFHTNIKISQYQSLSRTIYWAWLSLIPNFYLWTSSFTALLKIWPQSILLCKLFLCFVKWPSLKKIEVLFYIDYGSRSWNIITFFCSFCEGKPFTYLLIKNFSAISDTTFLLFQ